MKICNFDWEVDYLKYTVHSCLKPADHIDDHVCVVCKDVFPQTLRINNDDEDDGN